MALPVGSAIPVVDDSIKWYNVNSVATSDLADGAMDAEAKMAIPQAVFGDVTFRGALAGVGDVGAYLSLYRRDLLVDGVNNCDVPTLTNKAQYVGPIRLPESLGSGVTTTVKLSGVPLNMAGACELYILNETGQIISAGYELKVTNISYNAQGA